ncbi:hypothetical protein EUGRSUZ_G00192 [Eucalyptus grandis]|uniref:Uncharacterized protein n=2 Tax=Eucalyptus grandis TaxID=71139 RepID=A0ACC3JZU7_EUCGR|nr:hypothetical protein EUGRSUZ_G00192 [Eucalyptus grandis]
MYFSIYICTYPIAPLVISFFPLTDNSKSLYWTIRRNLQMLTIYSFENARTLLLLICYVNLTFEHSMRFCWYREFRTMHGPTSYVK